MAVHNGTEERLGPERLGTWAPLSPARLKDTFRGAPFRWWLAGGWALDHFIGRTTRAHGDIEIAVLRDDQLSLRRWLSNWEVWYVPAPGGSLVRWREPALLAPDTHELWCRDTVDGPWRLEVLVEDVRDGRWLYRRDHRVSLPLDGFGTEIDGVPVVSPEIVLLYKSKRPRERDEADLHSALPELSEGSRAWLVEALRVTAAPGSWIAAVQRYGR